MNTFLVLAARLLVVSWYFGGLMSEGADGIRLLLLGARALTMDTVRPFPTKVRVASPLLVPSNDEIVILIGGAAGLVMRLDRVVFLCRWRSSSRCGSVGAHRPFFSQGQVGSR